jgi:hypothetical protein
VNNLTGDDKRCTVIRDFFRCSPSTICLLFTPVFLTMSEHSIAATEGTSTQALSSDAFVQALRQARIAVSEQDCGNERSFAVLTTCLHLPPPAVIARWLEDFYAPIRFQQHQIEGCFHGADIITAHRTFLNRENMVITFTLPIVVWKTLRETEVSRHITFLSKVAENNVVGDPQMTHLLNRAAKRINEAPLREEQLQEDLERVLRSMVESSHYMPYRRETFPKVMFTVQLSNDCFSRLMQANPLIPLEQRSAQFSWRDVDTRRIARGLPLEFISEAPADEGSTVTFVITKEFWPYLEATSESYRFVRYIEEQEWYEMFPDEAPTAPAPESETTSKDRPSHKKPNRKQKKQTRKQRKAALLIERSKKTVDGQNNIIMTRSRSARIRKS